MLRRTRNGKVFDLLEDGFTVLRAPTRRQRTDFDRMHEVASRLTTLSETFGHSLLQPIRLASLSTVISGHKFEFTQENGFYRVGMHVQILPFLINGYQEEYEKIYDLEMIRIHERVGNGIVPDPLSREYSVDLLMGLREPARLMRELLPSMGITKNDIERVCLPNADSSIAGVLVCYQKGARVNGRDEDHRDNVRDGVVLSFQLSQEPIDVEIGHSHDELRSFTQNRGDTIVMNCFPTGIGSVQRPIHNFFVPDNEEVESDAAVRTAFLCVVKGPLARELVVRLGAVSTRAFPVVSPSIKTPTLAL